MEQKTINELIADISSCCAIPITKIEPEMDLMTDLGMAGDDGYELLEYLSDKYNRNLKDIDFYPYFGDEDYDIVTFIYDIFRLRKKGNPRLTVNDLLKILNNAPATVL